MSNFTIYVKDTKHVVRYAMTLNSEEYQNFRKAVVAETGLKPVRACHCYECGEDKYHNFIAKDGNPERVISKIFKDIFNINVKVDEYKDDWNRAFYMQVYNENSEA